MRQKKHKPEDRRQVAPGRCCVVARKIGWRSGSFDRRDTVHVLAVAQGVRRPERRQVKRLKELEKENDRLRKAVSDLTLEKLILKEAASGNY